MRLRTQLILLAATTALLCGGLGVGLISRNLKISAEAMLEGQLQIGEAALIRQWTLSRAERQRAYEAIARQPYLRAYLAANEAGQMDYYASVLRNTGASAVAITDRGGRVMAQAGDDAPLLVERAKRGTVERSGTLLPMSGYLMTAYRFPIGGESPIGYVLASNRFEPDQLRADTSALGLEAALLIGGVFVSTLPAKALAARELQQATPGPQLIGLHSGYYLRVRGFEGGLLLLALPRDRVSALTTTFPTQLLGLILLIILATSVVALVVLSRVTGPLERLQGAVGELGNGRIVDSQRILRAFPKRQDELGHLAREFQAAIRRIRTIVQRCQELSSHLSEMAEGLDQTATTLARDAERQGQRLGEVSTSFKPLTEALQHSSHRVGELTRLAGTAARSVRHIEQEASTFQTLTRRASERLAITPTPSGVIPEVSSQLGSLAKNSFELLSQLGALNNNLNSIAHTGNSVLNEQIHEQHQGEFILRAIAEIDRLSKAHTKQAAELRTTAEALRSDIGRMNDALALFDTGALARAALSSTSTAVKPVKP